MTGTPDSRTKRERSKMVPKPSGGTSCPMCQEGVNGGSIAMRDVIWARWMRFMRVITSLSGLKWILGQGLYSTCRSNDMFDVLHPASIQEVTYLVSCRKLARKLCVGGPRTHREWSAWVCDTSSTMASFPLLWFSNVGPFMCRLRESNKRLCMSQVT